MKDQGRRDRAIEHVLRRSVAPPHAVNAPEACVDGETLAAWSSGALGAADAARVDNHLADCARCQSMLAAFARTAPIVEAPAPWWRRAHVRWLVPLATAATVAAIWVAMPPRVEPPPPAAQVRDQRGPENYVTPDASPPGSTPDRRALADQPSPQARTETPARSPRGGSSPREVDAPSQRKESEALRQEAKEELQKQRVDEATGGAGARARAANELAAAAPPPAAAALPAAPSAAPRSPAAPARESRAMDSLTPQLRMALPATAEIIGPGGAMRWRIVDGRVQRSTTQGQTWEPIALPSAAAISGGHSPAASVAWLVGKAGAIFVTTDGAEFQQVPFVSSADLVSVVAVDDRQATVTTAEGRQFQTTNRGLNWTQR